MQLASIIVTTRKAFMVNAKFLNRSKMNSLYTQRTIKKQELLVIITN